MKNSPIRLDRDRSALYFVRVENGKTYGPYQSMASARKAAGRAGIHATILRAEFIVDSVEEVTQYTPEGGKG